MNYLIDLSHRTSYQFSFITASSQTAICTIEVDGLPSSAPFTEIDALVEEFRSNMVRIAAKRAQPKGTQSD